MKCTAKANTTGKPCSKNAVDGAVVCATHGAAKGTLARKKADVRAEVSSWRLGDTTVDPGEQLLRLLSQSARRAALYSLMLEQAFEAAAVEAQTASDEAIAEALGQPVDEATARAQEQARLRTPRGYPDGAGALIGNTIGASEVRGFYAKGEEVRGLVKLEAEERERCARWAKMCLDAGIAERQVRVLEQQASEVVALIRRIVTGLGLRPNSPEVVAVVTRELRAIEGSLAGAA